LYTQHYSNGSSVDFFVDFDCAAHPSSSQLAVEQASSKAVHIAGNHRGTDQAPTSTAARRLVLGRFEARRPPRWLAPPFWQSISRSPSCKILKSHY
jgi:hypothetical protein